MRPFLYLLFVAILSISGCVENQQLWQQGASILDSVVAGGAPLTSEEIGLGLKDALKVGTGTVVGQLGRKDGFNLDPAIHIPLPEDLRKMQQALGQVGLSSLLDDVELKLNRAAETATPKAKQIFWQAVRDMSFKDVMAIYNGPDDAATRYFQKKMSPALAREMEPVITSSLAEVGAIRAYDRAVGKYQALPFVPDIKADLTAHVLDRGMEGMFYYLAREEKAIRQDPAKRTTELLQRVFAGR